ncbi:MAG: hypothetical protein WDN76_06435 [Alphaproteobacteria bacterium]
MLRRLLNGTGRPDQAHEVALAAVAAAQNDRERAIGLDELGVACALKKGQPPARIRPCSNRSKSSRALAARAPDDAERQRDVAVGQYKLASLGGPDARDRLVASIGSFERLEKIGALPPSDMEALSQLKTVLADLDQQAAEKK